MSPTLPRKEAQEFDLQLSTGRIRARRSGPVDAPLVLLIHGLSAHLHSFDLIVEQLAGPDRQLVAVDLRGRGRSSITPSGSYGLAAHARDVLEIANLLGAAQFDLIGWSMGALIGILVASQAPQRLRKLVLLDHAGAMDRGPTEKILRGLERLDLVCKAPTDYLEIIRGSGSIEPWSSFWDHFYRYELTAVEHGFQPSTSKMACAEDLQDLLKLDFAPLWFDLAMPVLLIRCMVPIAGGLIVPQHVTQQIQDRVPHLQLVELEFDHYQVMVNKITGDQIEAFLSD